MRRNKLYLRQTWQRHWKRNKYYHDALPVKDEAFMYTVAMLYRVPALLAFCPVHCPPVCLTLIIKADPLQPESRRDTAVSPGPFCFSSPRLELALKSKTSGTPKGFHQHFWNWSGWQVCLRWTQFGRVPPLLVILTDAVALRRTGQRSRNFWHLNNDN